MVPYGFAKNDSRYVVDTALFAVHYTRTQAVISTATGEVESLVDTLTLAIGSSWSVFGNMAYDARFSSWAKGNIKKIKKATKMSNSEEVPLSSVLDKKAAGQDYSEGDFGEPVKVYKNRDRNTVLSCLYGTEQLICAQPIEQFTNSWTISDVTEDILGYQCVKASTNYSGRKWEAWFTMDIPVCDGPWKLQGLPGLILKAKSLDGDFIFEMIGIENVTSSVITLNDNLEKVKPSYFNKIAQTVRSTRRGTFLYEGEMIFVTSIPYSFMDME